MMKSNRQPGISAPIIPILILLLALSMSLMVGCGNDDSNVEPDMSSDSSANETQSGDSEDYIGEDAALEIALEHEELTSD